MGVGASGATWGGEKSGSAGRGNATAGDALLGQGDESPGEGAPVQALLEFRERLPRHGLVAVLVAKSLHDDVGVVRRLGGERQQQAVVTVLHDGRDAAGLGRKGGHAKR